jgi:hypothetical protein
LAGGESTTPGESRAFLNIHRAKISRRVRQRRTIFDAFSGANRLRQKLQHHTPGNF